MQFGALRRMEVKPGNLTNIYETLSASLVILRDVRLGILTMKN